jgi:DNA-binding MarR family transcriptional regulator
MVNRSEASHEIVQLVPAVAINLRLATLFDLETVDLTANQILTLLLVKSAEGGRMKSGEIASRLGISLPAATALVDRLVASGVVARSQGEDRRVVWIAVTDEGAALLTRLGEGLEKRIDAVIADSDPAALDALVEGLRRVATFADRIGEPRAIDADGHLPP